MKSVPWTDGVTDLDALRKAVTGKTACVMVQYPNFFGCLDDLDQAAAIAHERGRAAGGGVDPVALALLRPPGESGADIVVGEGQSLGIPMNFGGPYVGLFACRKELVRRMPGRLVGATVDKDGKRGFVLTLQTREQHIRREKATSNICTNEALVALAATIHTALLGRRGCGGPPTLSTAKAHYRPRRSAMWRGCASGSRRPSSRSSRSSCRRTRRRCCARSGGAASGGVAARAVRPEAQGLHPGRGDRAADPDRDRRLRRGAGRGGGVRGPRMSAYDGLIFELSVPGPRRLSLPESDVPEAEPRASCPRRTSWAVPRTCPRSARSTPSATSRG